MKQSAAGLALSLLALPSLLVSPLQPACAAEEPGYMYLISPLAGYNQSEMTVQGGPHGPQITTQTDTAPVYGLFAMVAHPRFVANNYLFHTRPNDTDVFGNLFYLNLYGAPEATVTWNLGGGHLYHEIKPENEDIEVQVPMVKAGPLIRIKPWGITLNPYLGYAWERIETRRANMGNDSLLYGLSLDWRWRMVNLNVKYYYQDSREDYKGCNTVRARFVVGLGRHWGVATRFDYMEHMTTDDTSLMIGPVHVF